MAVSVLTDLEWLGAHAHLFDYHTAEAQRFHRQLLGWWSSMEGEPSRCAELWQTFRRLSSAGPVEAACGLAVRSEEELCLYTDRMCGDTALDEVLHTVPCAAITPRCGEAVYLPQQQCFAGAVADCGRRRQAVDAVLAHSAGQADRLAERLNRLTDARQQTDARLLYPALQAKGGFRLWKGAVAALFTAVGLALVPLWLQMVWTFLCSLLFETSFGVWESFVRVMYLPGCRGPILPICLLVGVPWAVFGWKQSVWEVWFSVYRRWALRTLAVRNRRRKAHTRRMSRCIRQAAERLRRTGRPWRMAAKPALAGFAAQMPAWVQVGKNPRLCPGKPHWLRSSFAVYPKTGPGRRKNASRHGGWVLLQAALCVGMLVLVGRWGVGW